MDRRIHLNLVIVLLMATSILAGIPPAGAQSSGILPAQDTAIKANQGAAAPFGSWTRVGEEVTLFLDRESTYDVQETPVGAPYDGASHAPAGNGDTGDDYFVTYEKNPAEVADLTGDEFFLDYQDPNDKKVIIESSPGTASFARWTLPLDLNPTLPVRLYGLEGNIYANCAQEPATAFAPSLDDISGLIIELQVDILDLQANGNWIRRDVATGTSGHQPFKMLELFGSGPFGDPGGVDAAAFVYTGELRFNNPTTEDGFLYDPATMRLQFSLIPSQASTVLTQAECVVHFGSATFPSFVRVLSDSGRLNMWHENPFGEPTQGVSSADNTQADRRRFLTQVVHASAWPQLNSYRRDRPEPVNYMDDFWDVADSASNAGPGDVVQGSQILYRVRDLQTIAIISGSGAGNIQTLDRDVFVLGNSVNRIEYLMFYPATLPDGRYRAEAASTEFGVAIAPDLVAGLKGFTFTPLDGLVHNVNAKEPTEFRFRVRNVGGEDDTVSVLPTPPGNSWGAEVIGGTHFLKANGGEAEVTLRVTPPEGAVAPSSQAITVTASSSTFPGELEPISQTATVNVVSAVTRGVDVTLNRTAVTIGPGVDTTLGGVRVRNTGTAGDNFLLQPVLPSTAVGWTAQATPLSKFIPANSSADFALRLRAPTDAPGGQTFILPVRATRLGDATVTDVQDLLVTVVVTHDFKVDFPASLLDTPDGLLASLGLPTNSAVAYMTGRNVGSACPPPPTPAGGAPSASTQQQGQCINNAGLPTAAAADTSKPTKFLYNMYLTNTGSVTDTYRVTMSWTPKKTLNGLSYTDVDGSNSCDGNDGDSPDFWRVAYNFTGHRLGDPKPFQDFITKAETGANGITVPAGTTVPVAVEFQTIAPTGTCIVSRNAPFKLVLRSTNDPGLEKTVQLVTLLTDAGNRGRPQEYANAERGAEIEADFLDNDRRAGANPGDKSSHVLRVRNTGNEPDNIVVSVPAGTSGWTRQLQQMGSVPSNIVCTPNAAKTRWVCPGMQIYEEAVFWLNVTSPATAAIGSFDSATAAASSAKDGAKGETLDFLTTVQGTFQYDAQGLVSTIDAEIGRTTLLPFVLKNQGTSGDRLNISVIQGDSAWTPRLGLPSSNFVPAGRELGGFLSVTPPAGATASKLFRLQVVNQGTGLPASQSIDTVDFTVTPTPSGALRVSGTPSNVTTISKVNQAQQVQVSVTGDQARDDVELKVVPGSLPAGWTVTPTTALVDLPADSKTGQASFTVTAPSGALGNSRVPLLLTASHPSSPAATGRGNLLMQLSDVFGVKLSSAGPTNQTIVPGGQVAYNVTVANLGTSTDTIRFTTSGAPTGWTVQMDPPELALGPLENRTAKLLVKAPADGAPRALATTTLQAASLGSGAVSSITTVTRVGFYELIVTGPNTTKVLAPTETGSIVYSVKNNGSLPDEVAILSLLDNSGVAGQVTFRSDPAVLALAPNQTKDVRIDVTLGAAPPSDSDVTANARFASRLSPNKATANVTMPIKVHVLLYASLDVDGDAVKEYAVNRDGSADNGFEDYLDTGVGGGKASTLVDLGRFLSEDARREATKSIVLADGSTAQVVDVAIDGDEDQRRDLFVDATSDGFPDYYWDPDNARSQDLNGPGSITKDIDGDAVPDYFVDTDAAAGVDKVYSLRAGTFTGLVEIDIDGDGMRDYIVDKNGNGLLDADETVLYSKSGRLLTVQKIDMDGNDELDSVFDTDGDGIPDYFIPAGEEGAVEIVLKDVNGDGKLDWAYDADGDGRLDSYYDPSTGEVGFIDAQSSFREALQRYWYIGALFGVVLALFVVLLFVTRR